MKSLLLPLGSGDKKKTVVSQYKSAQEDFFGKDYVKEILKNLK